jgi:hypothetical protein
LHADSAVEIEKVQGLNLQGMQAVGVADIQVVALEDASCYYVDRIIKV